MSAPTEPVSTKPSATVAIILRTKDRPTFLRRALADVLAQTYLDWVLVVVNDNGDPEPVDQLIDSVRPELDGRIHVVHRTSDPGREAASNTGIDAVDSTFIAIHDDDDTWAPTFLEQTVARLEEQPEPAVATRTEVIWESMDEGFPVVSRHLLAPEKSSVRLTDLLERDWVPPISMLYRRSLHASVGMYDTSLSVLGDWDFALKVLSRFPIAFIDGDPLAFWHLRADVDGSAGNSSVAGATEHQYVEGRLRDQYWRDQQSNDLGTLLLVFRRIEELENRAKDRQAHLEKVIGDNHYLLSVLDHTLTTQGNRHVARFERLEKRVDKIYELLLDRGVKRRAKAYGRRAAEATQRVFER